MDKQHLRKMIETPSVSGNEYALQKQIIEYMNDKCDQIITDHAGNVISVINPNSNIKVLLDAHIDEIGLVITNVKSDGRCMVSNLGAIRPSLYLGSQVQVVTKNGIIEGVIAQYKNSQNDKIDVSELELDLGTSSKEETLALIEIGDCVVKKESMIELPNNKVAGRAMDDKIGVYSIINALLLAKENKLTQGVYASSTVGEETSANGATFIGKIVNPTCAIVVDVITDTSSLPSLSNRCEIHLGQGPVLTSGTFINKKLSDLTKRIAKENNIPLQFDTAGYRTWTNADKIHYTDAGIPTILLSIPLRYMHSSAEVADMSDVNNLSNLIYLIIKEIDDSTSFNPYE